MSVFIIMCQFFRSVIVIDNYSHRVLEIYNALIQINVIFNFVVVIIKLKTGRFVQIKVISNWRWTCKLFFIYCEVHRFRVYSLGAVMTRAGLDLNAIAMARLHSLESDSQPSSSKPFS